MAAADPDRHLDLVTLLSAAFATEVAAHDLDEPVGWPLIPDVRSLVVHLGGVERWVTRVLRTRGPVRRREERPGAGDPAAWFAAGRAELLEALGSTPPGEPCWVLGGRTGTAGFWRRRMVHEHLKHLVDLRAAGGRAWRVAPEAAPADYADGVDELFAEFLPRSRAGLAALPRPVVLAAEDLDRSWSVSTDWTVHSPATPPAGGGPVRVHASAGDLALLVWERADPLADAERFRVTGDPAAVEAFSRAPVHPW